MAVSTALDGAMLIATQQAASAAQSAAEAAWWAVWINGLVVAAAVGTTFFQEWRVKQRVEASNKALHQGAVDTLRQGWIAIDTASLLFTAADYVDRDRVAKSKAQVERAQRLIKLFVAREVDPKILIGLLQMDDHLSTAHSLLTGVLFTTGHQKMENAQYNGHLNETVHAAELLFISLTKTHAAPPSANKSG